MDYGTQYVVLQDVSNLVYEDWGRAVGLLIALGVLIWAVVITIHVKRWKRSLLRKGSGMPRKIRRKWLVRHASKRIHDAFQEDYLNGKLSNAEFTALVRMMIKGMSLPALEQQKTWNLIDIATPTKSDTTKEHIKTIKEGVIARMCNWRLRKFLYKPVSIPGPKPGEGVKNKVIKPKGVLLSKRKTA